MDKFGGKKWNNIGTFWTQFFAHCYKKNQTARVSISETHGLETANNRAININSH